MRVSRIKLSPEETEAAYHVISRTVNGERLFDNVSKEVLRKQIWQVAAFCGVQVVTYAILDNHFHLVVVVPRKALVSDEELVRRYRVLYPRPTRYQTARLEVILSELATNGPRAEGWRRRQLALMGDLSNFVKLVKQRFSIWFNKSHSRFGTLWAERFKSNLVQPHGLALKTASAYTDLNPVRAGLVNDPKDYRFCGYAEAVAGNEQARLGIMRLVMGYTWEDAQQAYREMLFSGGASVKEGEARISDVQLQEVIKTGGKLPIAAALRCRVRYFTDGAMLGSQSFVRTQLESYRKSTGRRRSSDVHALPNDLTDWGGLATLRRPRGAFAAIT